MALIFVAELVGVVAYVAWFAGAALSQAPQLRGPCDPRPDAPVGPGMAPYQLTGALHLFGEAFRQRQGKRALKSVDPCPVRSAGLLTSEAL